MCVCEREREFCYDDMIYLLTVIVLTPGGNSTVRIYSQTIHRTTEYPERNIYINKNT
jgi:hypothetical protein